MAFLRTDHIEVTMRDATRYDDQFNVN